MEMEKSAGMEEGMFTAEMINLCPALGLTLGKIFDFWGFCHFPVVSCLEGFLTQMCLDMLLKLSEPLFPRLKKWSCRSLP